MSGQQHHTDSRILDRRTLRRDHRALAARLTPGLSVLDVGCGTGAITKGIADAVGPAGSVVGVDRDAGQIDYARAHHAAVPNLRFEQADATQLPFEAAFDVVTAARALQWISDVPGAIRSMARAARPGGQLVLLDYNHTQNAWDPAPPAAFARFYEVFLSWRAANGWDNEMADHLPAYLEAAGLVDVRSENQDEIAVKGGPDFDEAAGLWAEVIDNLGPTLLAAQVCDASLLDAARASYDAWRRTDLVRQTLVLRAIVGHVPRR